MKPFARVLLSLIVMVFISHGLNAQSNWTRAQSSPVLSPSGTGFDWSRAHDACVIKDGPVYRMWFTGNNGIGDAISVDKVHWYKANGNPVIVDGRGASVIRDHEGYKMYYYTGPDYAHSINLATSVDGYNWTIYAGNPVLTKGDAGTWESIGVWNPCVVKEGPIYKMWYQAYDGTFSSIGLAKSYDGYTWIKYTDNPVLLHGEIGTFDYYTAGQPSVLHNGNKYHMLYTSTSASMANNVGYAISSDGIHWRKYSGNPVFIPSVSEWDNARVAAGGLLFEKNKFHHWYGAQNSSGVWQIGYATSSINPHFYDLVETENVKIDDSKVALGDAFPNPFNPTSTIQYSLASTQHVELKVFNVLGEEVVTLANEIQTAGEKKYQFDGAQLPSGIYFCRIETYDVENPKEFTSQTKKLMLVK